MKIRIEGHELVDPEIEAVSLVKHGANRSPFKIVKSDQPTAGNPTVIVHRNPHNADVDPRYPQGRNPNPLADQALSRVGRHVAKHSLDDMLAHAWARHSARRK